MTGPAPAFWVLAFGLAAAAPGCPADSRDPPRVVTPTAAPVPADPPVPAAPEPEVRLEWVATVDAATGTPGPDPSGDPSTPSAPWKIPSTGLVRVHLRTAGPDPSATLLDARGRPVPHESRVYLVGSGPTAGARIDVDLLDPNAGSALTLTIRAHGRERTVPLRLE